MSIEPVLTLSSARKIDLLRYIIRPAVRFCLRSFISAPELIETVKMVFVELCEESTRKAEHKVTTSRLAVMSGLDRRDIMRLTDTAYVPTTTPSPLTKVFGAWEQNPRFSIGGEPRSLTYHGDISEFKQLVASVSKDLNPSAVLLELERSGAVVWEKERVKLVKSVNHSDLDLDKKLTLLFRNIETLSHVSEENVFAPQGVKNLHLRTEYDNVIKDEIPRIRKWFVKEGSTFHKRAREFLSKYDKDLNPDDDREGGGRVVLSAFSWTNVGVQAEDQRTILPPPSNKSR